MNKKELELEVARIGRPVRDAMTELSELRPTLTVREAQGATKSGKSKPKLMVYSGKAYKLLHLQLPGETSAWEWKFGVRPEDHVAPIRARAGYVVEAARVLVDMVANLRSEFSDDAGCRIAEIEKLQSIVDAAARDVVASPEQINEACDAYVARFGEVERNVASEKRAREREDGRREVEKANEAKRMRSKRSRKASSMSSIGLLLLLAILLLWLTR